MKIKFTLFAGITLMCVMLSTSSFAQTFFIKGDAEITLPITNRMMELNQKITTKLENSDYTVDCTNIVKVRGGVAKGFISIVDSKTGDLIAKTDEIKAMANVTWKDARPNVAEKIAKKHLSDLLLKIKK